MCQKQALVSRLERSKGMKSSGPALCQSSWKANMTAHCIWYYLWGISFGPERSLQKWARLGTFWKVSTTQTILGTMTSAQMAYLKQALRQVWGARYRRWACLRDGECGGTLGIPRALSSREEPEFEHLPHRRKPTDEGEKSRVSCALFMILYNCIVHIL